MTTKAPEKAAPVPKAAKPAQKTAAKVAAPKPAAPKPAAPKPAAPKPAAPKPAAPKPAAPKAAVEAEKALKAKKPSKVIRDSFTFPETDYQKISELKKACMGLGINAKKSEILRAGLHALASLDKSRLKEVISKIEKIKTGRPLGSEKS
ncbi:MAG TPA: hypothetical protein PLK99_11960 [Burkholderiales bacterium]|nr:hypothetical protein [Burkholderiales bacterium]